MRWGLVGRKGLLFFALVVLAASGCGTNRVGVRLHEAVSDISTEVHLVGVTEQEHQRWAYYSLSKYFAPRDPLYESATDLGYAYVMKFGRGQPDVQNPWVHNPEEWDRVTERWAQRGADYVFVLANLPGFADRPAEQDPRRLIVDIPGKPVYVLITKGGLIRATPPSGG